MTNNTVRLLALAAVLITAMVTGPEWAYTINELRFVPCDTDSDCQEKNPHLGVYGVDPEPKS